MKLYELVEYIALNDCPGDDLNEGDLLGLPSVHVAAIATGKHAEEIATRVYAFRSTGKHLRGKRLKRSNQAIP